ncbi:hypothetical protein L1987_15564 [Smallanthus sonchifolius]|uniref:Uncharacterized protein n=1 Tax=Smallanthus sonchifolius TaxID=185202 RepID=A0ACB9J845_9ASTR|nr:hypothetical protein L1987_15564 [Smallanthus sonchifolius]
MKVLFSYLIEWIGSVRESLQRSLAEEIRSVVKEEGDVTFSALEKMPLTKSAIYEALRIEPPVPFRFETKRPRRPGGQDADLDASGSFSRLQEFFLGFSCLDLVRFGYWL